MRLSAPIFTAYDTPDEWIASLRAVGYRAAYCPVDTNASAELVKEYAEAAAEADIVIAEVGAWCNPISDDPETRSAALDKCKTSLALADSIGAQCCVNIAGSRGEIWDGPHPDNLSSDTFEKIVASVREIIDEVSPLRSFYTLETMPWIFPDTADSYVELLRAIDRKMLGVHCDPVNIINSPSRYFRNGDVIKDFIQKLGANIKSCHAKDIKIRDDLTVHLDEVRPGIGALDYGVYLRELASLDNRIPLMVEHLPDANSYDLAVKHIRAVAKHEGISV